MSTNEYTPIAGSPIVQRLGEVVRVDFEDVTLLVVGDSAKWVPRKPVPSRVVVKESGVS
jgi:hypothetical protein